MVSGKTFKDRAIEFILEAPRCFHRRHAGPNQTDADHDAAHPYMRTQTGHDQVGREIKDHIADVEERETRRDLMVV